MDLYYMPLSAPCRSVQMTASVLGIDLNLKFLDLFKGEQNTPEFLKLNPQHVIPTLVDHKNNDLVLWESRAVMMYLADHYGKDDSLYPKDPTKRFLVNQRLFFDMTLYQKFGDYYYPQIFQQKLEDPEKIEPFKNALGFLNTFLEGNEWACGDKMTLADLALAATIDTFDISAGVNLSGYPNIVRWYKKCQETIPGYEANRKGSEEFKSFFATAKKI